MKYLWMCFVASLMAGPVSAAEIYSLKLNGSDSTIFEQFLMGFSGPKKIVDPEHASVFYSKRWYQSKNRAVTIACRVATVDGELYSTNCDFEVFPANSSSEVTIERKANGVVRATIFDPVAATQMYKNLEMNPFYSNETVQLKGRNGDEEVSRLYAECNPVTIAAVAAKNCVIEFVPN